jgi:hypothetical protein
LTLFRWVSVSRPTKERSDFIVDEQVTAALSGFLGPFSLEDEGTTISRNDEKS